MTNTEMMGDDSGGRWSKWSNRFNWLFLIGAIVSALLALYNVAQFVSDRWGPAEMDYSEVSYQSAPYQSPVAKRCPRHTMHGRADEIHDFDVPAWGNEYDAIECFGNEAGLVGEVWSDDLHFKAHAVKGRMTAMQALTMMLQGTPAATYGATSSRRSIFIVARDRIPELQAEDAAEAGETQTETMTH